MSLKKGDFVLVDYVAKVKETGEVFDTTLEEVAKKEHLFKESEIYEPKLVVVGEGWVLKALDDSLPTLEVEKPATTEIPQDKAFGARDPEKIRRVSLKQLLAKDVNPTLGMRFEYGGKMATVRAIGAGRVLLDFNPPLAGRTLVYDITIKRKIEDINERISALIHRRIPAADISKFEFAIKSKTLTIEMPEESYYLEGIQVSKRGVALDIQKFFPEITTVKFIETFKAEVKKPEKTAEAEKAEQKPEQPKPEAEKKEEAKVEAKP